MGLGEIAQFLLESPRNPKRFATLLLFCGVVAGYRATRDCHRPWGLSGISILFADLVQPLKQGSLPRGFVDRGNIGVTSSSQRH